MFLEYSFAGAGSHLSQLSVIGLFNSLDYVLRALGHQYFFTHSENRIQPGPWIGDDRTTAAGGLEQAEPRGSIPIRPFLGASN